MKITQTGDIFQDLANNLINLDKLMIKHLPELANNVVLRVKARIYTGRGTAGVIMTTNSRQKIGRYGAWHGGNRRKRGLQTDVVDLEYTGAMLKDYDVIKLPRGSIAVGFESETQAEKMEENELLYGFKIGDVEDSINDSEVDKFFDRIDKELGL